MKAFLFFLLLIGFCDIQLSAQNDTLLADKLYHKGKELYYDGEFKKARKPLLGALSLYQKIHGEEHQEVQSTYLRLGKNERYLREHNLALHYYNKGLEVAKKLQGDTSELVAIYFMQIGHTYSQMYQPSNADAYYEKTLKIYRTLFGEASSAVANIYMNFGISSLKMGNYYDADKYFQKTYKIFKQTSKPNSQDFYRIYSNYGYLFRKTGDYDKAIEYGIKALEIKLKHYDADHPSVAKYYSNLSKAYKGKEEYELAIEAMEKSLEIKKKRLGKEHPETAGTHGELGNIYADMGEPKKAIKLYKKAIRLRGEEFDPLHPYQVGSFFSIGSAYEDMGAFEDAQAYYTEALNRFKQNPHAKPSLLAASERKIAGVYFKQNDITQAIKTVQTAFQYIAPGFIIEERNYYKNPTVDQVQDDLEFLYLLEDKSNYLKEMGSRQNNLFDLEHAFKTAELSIQVIDRIRKLYQSESAKEFLNSNTAQNYKQVVSIAFDLYEKTDDIKYLIKAFEYSEKSKASILRQSLNDAFAFEASDLSNEEKSTINGLGQEIAQIEQEMYKVHESNPIYDSLYSKMFDLKLAYEDEINNIEKYNPKFYRLKYAVPNVEIDFFQSNLPNEATALIEYFYDDHNVYIFIVSKSGLEGHRVPLTINLTEAIHALKQSKSENVVFDKASNNVYTQWIHQLHELLIQPIEHRIDDYSNLVIVPHGLLQYLSFDLLAKSNDSQDFRELEYLIRSYDIQYAWSATLWADEPHAASDLDYEFVGFAPEFRASAAEDNIALTANRSNLSSLKYAETEVKSANSYFPGKLFLRNAASESQFIKNAPRSNIIHLATHALVNDQFPNQSGLLFAEEKEEEDGFLNILEIYNLNLSADLAVMSACNTGFGRLSAGEGVMSLGRAFMYAGCRSVLMSLWLANDASTNSILQSFYKYSSKGLNKDEALRQAKLDYIDQADALTAHPFFWANMVAIGDMSTLKEKWNPLPWISLLGFGILFSAILFWRRSK